MPWFGPGKAEAETPLHDHIVVFVPAYEGSALYDPALAQDDEEPPCVWGSIAAIRRQDLYFALRMPNHLIARPMLKAGPLDIYGRFAESLEQNYPQQRRFFPYRRDKDFFIFAYDWRQDIGTVIAPALANQLDLYARKYVESGGILTGMTPKFVIVTHSMGGLVARTMLSQNPRLAERVERLYLIGVPNLGSVKAIQTLLTGPGGLRENSFDFPASLVRLLPNDVDALSTKLVAITRPSLYELLPLRDPKWTRIDEEGHSLGVSNDDILTIGTWKLYWPSAQAERAKFLNPWFERFSRGSREPVDAKKWEFCQDNNFVELQNILVLVREWRLQLGTLGYTDRLLTRPGEFSRLRLVAGRGIQTPTGIISEGRGDDTRVRFLYEGEGDGTVTYESAIEDLDEMRVFAVRNVPHGKLMVSPEVISYLIDELAALVPPPAMRRTQPETRATIP
jgi:pimeloyl-ACP methyl ester carboxylesterase